MLPGGDYLRVENKISPLSSMQWQQRVTSNPGPLLQLHTNHEKSPNGLQLLGVKKKRQEKESRQK